MSAGDKHGPLFWAAFPFLLLGLAYERWHIRRRKKASRRMRTN